MFLNSSKNLSSYFHQYSGEIVLNCRLSGICFSLHVYDFTYFSSFQNSDNSNNNKNNNNNVTNFLGDSTIQ